MVSKSSEKQVSKWLSALGFFLFVVLIFWLLLMGMSPLSGTIGEQLLQLAEGSFIYQLTFFNASLIAPAITLIMVILALYIPPKKEKDFLAIGGVVFLGPYVLLASLVYTSQYSILPRLLHKMTNETVEEVALWYFYNPDSIVYFFDLLGYVLFGLAAICIGAKFLRYSGLLKAVGIVLWASGIFALIGFGGYALENGMLELGVLLSGILIIPLAIFSIIIGLRQISTLGEYEQDIQNESGASLPEVPLDSQE